MTVQVKADSLRAHLSRLTERVFELKPNKNAKRKITLSAYHFRHAFVTDLRESDWVPEEIAAVIGESSAETVSWYGKRSRVGNRKPRSTGLIKSSVTATRPVKGLDRSGLASVQKVGSKGKRKLKSGPK